MDGLPCGFTVCLRPGHAGPTLRALWLPHDTPCNAMPVMVWESLPTPVPPLSIDHWCTVLVHQETSQGGR